MQASKLRRGTHWTLYVPSPGHPWRPYRAGNAAATARRTCSNVTTPREDAVAVHRHERAERPQLLGAEQGLQRLLGVHAPPRRVPVDDLAHRPVGVPAGHGLGDGLLAHEPEKRPSSSTTGNQCQR